MVSRRSDVSFRENRLAEARARRLEEGLTELDLTVSNPTAAGIPYAGEAILRALADPAALRYEPRALGLPSARAAVSALWHRRGFEVGIERIALVSSTSEAYSVLFEILGDPGDAVLVPAPSYPLFEHLARYTGLLATPYPLVYDGAWHIDLPALRARVTERTRAVVVVSPNNPTGSFVAPSELAALAELGLPVVSDEVFAEYPLAGEGRGVRSSLVETRPLVFALDGLSKLAGLPQMKLAWITIGGPDERVREVLGPLELLLDTFLSPSAPVQHALPALLATGDVTRAAISRRTRDNYAALEALTTGSAVTPLPAEGGWYAVLRLPSTRDEEDWALAILEADEVLAQPGYFYDFAGGPYLVVSLLTPEATFREGIRRIVRRVDAER